MNVQHSSRTDNWHTPIDVLARVHNVLGTIDFDPASCAAANTRVRAKRYLTSTENGLVTDWECGGKTVYLNPPGGKTGNQSNVVLFWKKLMTYREEFYHAIFMAFSLEALQTTQGRGCPSIGDFPFCIPAKRIRFLYPDGTPGPAPSHSNVIAYVPGKTDNTDQFVKQFNALGKVVIP